jgi:hypothetical protein
MENKCLEPDNARLDQYGQVYLNNTSNPAKWLQVTKELKEGKTQQEIATDCKCSLVLFPKFTIVIN